MTPWNSICHSSAAPCLATLDARQAVDFALELQTRFYAHDWGTTVLDDVYCAMEKVHAEQAKGAHAAELWGHNPACWNGLCRTRLWQLLGRLF